MPSGFGMRIPLPVSALPRPEDYPEVVPKHDAVVTVDGSTSTEVDIRVARGGSVSGKVMKANGAPVVNAAVNLVSHEDGVGPYTARFSTRTDQKGLYKFENVPAAEYLVSAATEDKTGNFDIRARMRGEAQIVTFHPAALRVADALPVKVDAGRESGGVNITLVDRKTLSVSGKLVMARDGSPVSGATVVLRNKDSDLTGPLMPGASQRMTTTTTDGRWSFSNVNPGDYEVTALSRFEQQDERRPAGGPPMLSRTEAMPRRIYPIAQEQLSVVSNDVEELTLTVRGTGSIRGVVETDGGEPLPNNLVLFFEFATDGSRPNRPEPVRVSPDGSFELQNVPAGDRRLMVGLIEGSGFYVVSTTAGEKNLTETPLSVVEDAAAEPMTVRISKRLAMVSGTLLDRLPENAEDAVVLFVPSDVNRQRFRLSYVAARVTSNGTFQAKLPPGDYLVLARTRDRLPSVITPEFMRRLGADVQKVSLLPDARTTVQVRLNE